MNEPFKEHTLTFTDSEIDILILALANYRVKYESVDKNPEEISLVMQKISKSLP